MLSNMMFIFITLTVSEASNVTLYQSTENPHDLFINKIGLLVAQNTFSLLWKCIEKLPLNIAINLPLGNVHLSF